MSYDAILIVSFGGPEGHDDVLPFLENVLRGKNVPRERMMAVAEHYYHFDGRSPINDHVRALLEVLRAELTAVDIALPLYWGNRNWHPFLADTVRQMKADGVTHALTFVTSAFSSYSGCRQYLDDMDAARVAVGGAPQLSKLRAFFNHPGFIETMTDRVRAAIEQVPAERRAALRVLYTAHSIPALMAATSPYVAQLQEACRLVSAAVGRTFANGAASAPNADDATDAQGAPLSQGAGTPRAADRLVYQSRSGPPTQPWLEPDILVALREEQARAVTDVVIVPIGFLSDHMEVLFDLDTQARELCNDLGLHMVRAGTAGTHPRFVAMIRELIAERLHGDEARPTVGALAAAPDACPADCCPRPVRPAPSGVVAPPVGAEDR